MRILIVSRMPLGYLTDALKFCKYASTRHELQHLAFDRPGRLGAPWRAMTIPGVTTHSVPWKGPFLVRYMRWLHACISHSARDNDWVYVYYFPTCSVLRLLLPRTRFVLDIRTGSVHPSRLRRFVDNLLLGMEARTFCRVHVVSEGLRERLGLRHHAEVVPLGAEPVATRPRSFDGLHLLYVGTFGGRRIGDTLRGFARFYGERRALLELRYTIIGAQPHHEWMGLQQLASELRLGDAVVFAGYIPNEQLGRYFEQANVGVSYVPISACYDHQPPTKTFEYLLAGIPVLATGTTENRRVVNDRNGVLVPDTPDGFYEGLCRIAERRYGYDSSAVRESAAGYSWKDIIQRRVVPLLESYD